MCGSKIMKSDTKRTPAPMFHRFLFIIFCGIPFSSFVGGEDPENRCEIQLEDVSKYSASTLSGVQTMPYVRFEDGSTYRLEPEEPDIDDETMIKSRRRIGESPIVMEQKKEELRKLLKDHKKYHVPWKNDAWLIRFLRARYYDVKKTMKLIEEYYMFRASNNAIYDSLVPSGEKEAIMQEVIFPLPNRDQLGRRIIVARANKWKPDKYPMETMCRTAAVLMELGCYEPATQISGLQFIIDLKDATLYQLLSIDLYLAWKMGNWVLYSVPMRYEGIHVVNEPAWFWSSYQIFKYFVPKEIRNEIQVHGTNWTSLHEYIEAPHLPLDYGGELPNIHSLSSHEWDVLLAFGDREFQKIQLYGIRDGSEGSPSNLLRRGKSQSASAGGYSKLE